MPTLHQSTVDTIATLQPHSIVIYKSFPRKSREKSEVELLNLEKGKNGDYNGYLSPATARAVKKFLNAWLTALELNIRRHNGVRVRNRYFPTFVTLTLPAEQFHDDNFIKRHFLERLLKKLRRVYGVKYSFWRAEPQKNGNVHFHLLLDKFVAWRELRTEWNAILADHGYIELYQANMKAWHKNGFRVRKELLKNWPIDKQLKAYEYGERTNWTDPNSTDIHQLEKVDSLAAYITKYVTKCETGRKLKDMPKPKPRKKLAQPKAHKRIKSRKGYKYKRKILGRVWGASRELKQLKNFSETVSISSDFTEFSNPTMTDYLAKIESQAKPADIFEDDFVKVIRLKKPQHEYLREFSPELYSDYRKHYKTLLADLYQVPLFSRQAEQFQTEFIPEPAPF